MKDTSLRAAFAAFLAVICGPSLGRADPCTAAGSGDYENGAGAGPSPVAETAVRMVSETVDFVEADDGASWSVKARYVFANERDRPIRTTMIFPWDAPDRYCSLAALLHSDRPPPGQYELLETALQRKELEGNGFAARVDGEPVLARFVRGVACADGAKFPFGHTFPMEFAPQSTRMLEVEYSQAAGPRAYNYGGGGCPCHGVGFILSTGAAWRGTIGEITMRYVLAAPTAFIGLGERTPLDEDYPDACQIGRLRSGRRTVAGVPFDVAIDCRDNRTTVTLAARDAEPTGRVVLAVHGVDVRRRVLAWQGCALDPATHRPATDCCPRTARLFDVPEEEDENERLAAEICFASPPAADSAPTGHDAAGAAAGEPGTDAVAHDDAGGTAEAPGTNRRRDAGDGGDTGSFRAAAAGAGGGLPGVSPADAALRADAAAEDGPKGAAGRGSGCGCSAATSSGGGLLALLGVAALAAARRRKGRRSAIG